MSNELSYFSRFTVKFIEIAAAGIATAVSGYLIAHLGGFLSAPVPAPAAAQVAPSVSVVSKSPRAQSAPSVSADANEQRPAPAQEVAPPSVQPARTTANATQAVSPHKHAKTDTSAAESKPRDEESVEARVRAALANVGGNRPAAPEAPPHQADGQPGPPVVEAPPRPAEAPLVTGAIAVAPRAAEIAPQPVQQAPAQPDPLTTVEIKSLPVAGVEELPPPQPAAPAQKDAQAEDKGLLSAIKKIPDLLRSERSDSHAPAGDAPRPPMPVGE